ncbi:TetR/AcrR family transcriptional regulator [Novosphingobium aquae]|uniref:TetR/AcrR family transcriptional regulator n=1 Tax=Novosphingobium aquae TaxID=3133435 RepID=A0ABU8SA18_9SPHN
MSEKLPKRRRGRPRLDELEAVDVRDRILASSLIVFAERGFDAASVRTIAGRAGVTHTMVTYYYSTKEDLWAAAVEFLFERMERELAMPAVPAEITDAQLIEYARVGLRKYVRYSAQHPEHHRLMIQEAARGSKRLAWVTEKFTRKQHMAGFAAIKMLQDKGVLPPVDTLSLIYMAIGAAQLPYALSPELKLIWNDDPSSQERVEAHIEAMIAMFIPEQ